MMILMLMMMVQESVKMCLNVLKRPISALNYKIISMSTTIDTSLNLLTGLLLQIQTYEMWDFMAYMPIF